MNAYRIRPKFWAEEVILLLPKLRDGDTLLLPTHVMQLAVKCMLKRWNLLLEISMPRPPDRVTGRCHRCTNVMPGPYCANTCCAGALHRHTCPRFWDGLTAERMTGIRNAYGGLRHQGKEFCLDGPCNCGGDELEHSVRHAADQLRMPTVLRRVSYDAGQPGAG